MTSALLLLACLAPALVAAPDPPPPPSISSAPALDLPSEFTKCRADDPGLDACLRVAVAAALRLMRDGVPSLGVESLEPLRVRAVDIDSGAGPVRIAQSFRHIHLHGLTHSTLKYYKADLARYRLVTESATPVLQFLGDYVMKGRVIVLPISGRGRANITLAGLRVRHDLVGAPVVRDGRLYMHIQDYKVTFTPTKVYLHFENLFNGDKLLGEQMNKFLNENADLVFNELKGAYERALGAVFRDIANKFFDSVPLHTIFPRS